MQPLESLEGIYPTRGGSSCRTKASASRVHAADLKATELQLGPGLRAARDGILDWERVGGWGCVFGILVGQGNLLDVSTEGTLLDSSMIRQGWEGVKPCAGFFIFPGRFWDDT